MERPDVEITLPSVVAALRGSYHAEQLSLTIVFHPDSARIGQRAWLDCKPGPSPCVLGRRCPDFSHPGRGGDGEPLDDPHVSRRALVLSLDDEQLLIERDSGTSRAQLGDKQVHAATAIGRDTLRIGVPLLLGHSIVLLLRLQPTEERHNADAGSATPGRDLQGSSAAMRQVYRQIYRAAAAEADVLLRGETGTGKELVARAIHRLSERGSAAFVPVNMAAIPPELAPAALFGSAKGAFTGAAQAEPGYFVQADGGSLFLDEIGEVSAQVQPMLLRALQQREIQTVGGPVRRVNVRVISATDAAIDTETANFKAALRHRLGAIEIVLPSLRERSEDVGELLTSYLQHYAKGMSGASRLPHAGSSAKEVAIWATVYFHLTRYAWPGNVRELTNVARQIALALEEEGPLLTLLTPFIAEYSAVSDAQALSQTAEHHSPSLGGARRRMIHISDDEFAEAMAHGRYEPAQVARELRVSRAAVYRRLQSSDVFRLAADIPDAELRDVLDLHRGDVAAAAAALEVSYYSLQLRLRSLVTDEL